MFKNNKYTNWYNLIISKAQNREFEIGIKTEIHHIIPKSLNGSNNSVNKVKLTFREHFLCHWLLTKMTEGEDKYLMKYAFRMMLNYDGKKNTRIISSWQYDTARKALKGVKHNSSFKLKQKENNSGSKNPMFGRNHSESTKRKMKLKQLSRPSWSTCSIPVIINNIKYPSITNASKLLNISRTTIHKELNRGLT